MFRKLLIATALVLGFAGSADAQNPTCPTRPAGDSTNACASTAFVFANTRNPLRANANYYVNGDTGSAICGPAGSLICSPGNDSNDCLSPATACLTLSHVYQLVNGKVDLANNFLVNVYLAHNTGTQNYALSCVGGPAIGSSINLHIIGDSTNNAATVVQAPPGQYGLQVKDLCTIEIDNLKYVDNATNNAAGAIQVGGTGNAGHIDFGNIEFGTFTIGSHISAGSLGLATATGPITISGGAPISVVTSNGGMVDFSNQTVTLVGTPTFNTAPNGAFWYSPNNGMLGISGSNFSGTAHGTRAYVVGPINLGGFNPDAGAAVLPGDSASRVNQQLGAVSTLAGDYGTAGQAWLSGGGAGTPDSWGAVGIAAGGTGVTSGAPTIQTPIVNINFAVAGDVAIPIPLPSGYTQACTVQLMLSNASGNLSTSGATFGVFTTTGGGGAPLLPAGTASTITTGAANTNNNYQSVLVTNGNTECYTPTGGNFQFRVGATAAFTAKVQLQYRPVP